MSPYKDPEEQREYQRKWVEKKRKSNKEEMIKQTKDRKRRRREKLIEYKKTQKCSKCGEDRWYVLDFHHNGEKDKAISTLVSGGYSWKRVEEEIKKCIVLCANCHRELHFLKNV